MSEESPLFPLQPLELISESKSLFKSSLPISLTHLAGFATSLISFSFAGKNGNPFELAGFGFGSTLMVLFCLNLFLSVDQGFTILASKLFGAKKFQELGVLYQRHLLIAMIISIPMILAMLFSDSILMYLGLDKDVSLNAGILLRSMIPSVIGTFLFSSTRHFLISQNILRTPTIILLSLIPVHALLCHIFVDILGMGVAAIGFAKSITDVTAAILLFSYIRFTGVCRDTWIPWTKECLENKSLHLQRTFVLGGTNFFELATYEFSTIIIGSLNDVSVLGAYTVAMNLIFTILCIPVGIGLSMQAMIGNAIGKGHKEKVKKILAGGIVLNLFTNLITVPLLVAFRKQIASFYIVDNFSNEVLQSMLVFVAIAHFFESFANIIGGVLRVVGKERQVLGAFLVCFWGIGVNGQWIFGVKQNYGYIAVWLFTVIAAFSMFVFVVYQICALDWKAQIGKVKRALDMQVYAETQSLIEFADMT